METITDTTQSPARCQQPIVRAVESVIAALENPIGHVWPDCEEEGFYCACYTPNANPEEMLVVVDGNALLAIIRAALNCPNNKDAQPRERL